MSRPNKYPSEPTLTGWTDPWRRERKGRPSHAHMRQERERLGISARQQRKLHRAGLLPREH